MAHICYFSKKCRFCQAFLEALASSPFKHEVRVVCVDPSPTRPPLPAWLKSVPSLLVAGESEPRVGPAAVNNWLFERNLLGSSSSGSNGGFGGTSTKSNTDRRAPVYSADIAVSPPPSSRVTFSDPVSANTPASSKQGPPSLPGGDGEGPLAWHGAEMSGGNWSDSYSFLGDTFTAEKGLNAIVRNFELLGGGGVASAGGGSAASAASGGAPQVKRSAKEERLNADFEAFAKSRDMEFSGPRRIG
jgi:hypothetical protein